MDDALSMKACSQLIDTFDIQHKFLNSFGISKGFLFAKIQ